MPVPIIPPLNFSQVQHQPQHTLQHTSQLQHQLQTPPHPQQQPAVVVAEPLDLQLHHSQQPAAATSSCNIEPHHSQQQPAVVVAEPLDVAEPPVPAAGKICKNVSPIDIGNSQKTQK